MVCTQNHISLSSLHILYCFPKFCNWKFCNAACVADTQVINPQRACVVRVTVVGSVCLCLSVKSHLTCGVSVRLENAVTYSVGNEGGNIFSETAPLQSSSTSPIVWLSIVGHFSLCAKTFMCYHHVCMLLHTQPHGRRGPTRLRVYAPRVCTLVLFIKICMTLCVGVCVCVTN